MWMTRDAVNTFDLLSLPPVKEEFIMFFDKSFLLWEFNTKSIQHMLCDACGCHCIFDIYRCVGFYKN